MWPSTVLMIPLGKKKERKRHGLAKLNRRSTAYVCALLRTPPLPIPSLFPGDTLQMLLRGMEMPTGVAQGRWIVALAIRAKTSPALPPAAESLLWIDSRGMLKPGYVFCVRRDAGYTHTARLVPWQIVGDYVALLHGICCRMRKSATLQREREQKTAAEHDCILYSVRSTCSADALHCTKSSAWPREPCASLVPLDRPGSCPATLHSRTSFDPGRMANAVVHNPYMTCWSYRGIVRTGRSTVGLQAEGGVWHWCVE